MDRFSTLFLCYWTNMTTKRVRFSRKTANPKLEIDSNLTFSPPHQIFSHNIVILCTSEVRSKSETIIWPKQLQFFQSIFTTNFEGGARSGHKIRHKRKMSFRSHAKKKLTWKSQNLLLENVQGNLSNHPDVHR